jgi:hypothetical protein
VDCRLLAWPLATSIRGDVAPWLPGPLTARAAVRVVCALGDALLDCSASGAARSVRGYRAPDPAGPVSLGPDPAGPASLGPDPAGPASLGPDPAGPASRAADPAGPASRAADPAGPVSRAADPAGPVSRAADPAGPVSRGPDPTGSVSRGPEPAGPVSRGPDPAGPTSQAPDPAGRASRGPVRLAGPAEGVRDPDRERLPPYFERLIADPERADRYERSMFAGSPSGAARGELVR